ncbi:MAG: hypothetical protein ACRD3R_05290 [Terriglobales bacterium]
MAETKDQLTKLVDDLKRQRDEIKLKLHLAKADARDEWNKLEVKLEQVKGKLDTARQEAGTTAGQVGKALELAVDELKKGYERIKKLL